MTCQQGGSRVAASQGGFSNARWVASYVQLCFWAKPPDGDDNVSSQDPSSRPQMDLDTTVVERGAMTRGGGLSVRDRLAERLGASLALLGIIAGALLLRLHNLELWGLWDDELFSAQHALEPFNFLGWQPLARVPHRIWFELAGVDVASLDPKQSGPGGRPASPNGPCGRPWRSRGAHDRGAPVRQPSNPRRPADAMAMPAAGALAMAPVDVAGLPLLHAAGPALQPLPAFVLPGDHGGQPRARGRRNGMLGARLLHLADRTDDRGGVRGRYGHELAPPPAHGMRPAFWAMGIEQPPSVWPQYCHVGAGPEQSALRIANYAEFKGTPQSIAVMTVGMVYLIGVPMVVIAALGWWALFQRNERLATLLAAASAVPLAAFIALNCSARTRRPLYVRGPVRMVDAGRGRHRGDRRRPAAALGTWSASLPAVACSHFALTDYIYMTGGAGIAPCGGRRRPTSRRTDARANWSGATGRQSGKSRLFGRLRCGAAADGFTDKDDARARAAPSLDLLRPINLPPATGPNS